MLHFFLNNPFIRPIHMPCLPQLPSEILEKILEYTLDDPFDFNIDNLRHLLEASVIVSLPLMSTVGSVCKYWRRRVLIHYYCKINQYLDWYKASAEQKEKIMCDHMFLKGSFEYYLHNGTLTIWEIGNHFDRASQLSLMLGFFQALCWYDKYHPKDSYIPLEGVTKQELMKCKLYTEGRPCPHYKKRIRIMEVRGPYERREFDQLMDHFFEISDLVDYETLSSIDGST